MRNFLIATSALALAGGMAAMPAAAADKLSIGVGGYMQQWVGMASVDDSSNMVQDGVAQQSDSEIFFKGKMESDSGLTFSVKVELEGNNNSDGATAIDESQLTIGGGFGQVTLGAEDPASTLTHHGGLDVGISLNCGDTHKWIGGGLAGCSHNGFGTYGHGHGDKNQIMYMSPRLNGIQFGASYIPDTGQEASNKALNDNMNDAWAIGGNFVGDFGEGLAIEVSLGHYQASQMGTATDLKSGMNDDKITVGKYMSNVMDIEAYNKAKADGTTDAAVLQDLAEAALTAKTDNDEAFDMKGVKKADDKTFSNAALHVGVGSFKFGVVYATNDGGAYMVQKNPMVVNANAGFTPTDTATCLTEGGTIGDATPHCFTVKGSGDTEDGDLDTNTPGKQVAESASLNDPDNDTARTMLVKDMSKNWDTWGAGVKYSDGPMAMSFSHLATEWDNGDEQEATMLSVSYTLAPGVASKSTILMAEKSSAGGREIDGTAFVTGIVIGF